MSSAITEKPGAIIRDIQSAFAGVRRGGVTLHEAEVIDVYGSAEERKQARKIDTDTRWDQVPDAHIEACRDALCFLDPESWRYYIAPYMIWSLRHLSRTRRKDVIDSTIYTFLPTTKPGDLREHSLARYRTLNQAQAQCVYRFLTYMSQHGQFADDGAARKALRKYWARVVEIRGA